MFADLVNAPTRRRVDDSLAAAKSKSALAQRLHGLSETEQHAVLLDLVRSHIATVLGNTTPEADRSGQGVPGTGLRLADRRRDAQPAQSRYRTGAFADA